MQQLIEDLIRFETVYPHYSKFSLCMDYIKGYFKNTDLHLREVIWNNDRSLIISNVPTKAYDILFCGHIDVVPAPPHMFIPQVKGDLLIARGAADMKSQVAVMIEILKNHQKSSNKIGLFLTSDEERGGFNGVQHLLQKEGYTTKIAIVPDGGENFELVIEEKGVLQVKITSHRKSSHSAYLWEGDNAILHLYQQYHHLMKQFPQPTSLKDWRTSINLAKITCENAINKVPSEASMLLDIRHIANNSQEHLLKTIHEASPENQIDILATGDPFICDVSNPLIAKFCAISASILQRPLTKSRIPSSSDARFFSKQNIPCVIMNPVCGNLHQLDEWVSLKSLNTLYRIYDEFCASPIDANIL